jgi:ParB family chromosome partitioning protein
MFTQLSVPLPELHYGHEAARSKNARQVGRDDGLESLAASIASHGLLHPLIVRREAGKTYVVDGNRRLAAIRLLEKRGTWTESTVPCDERDARAARSATDEEVALAANVMRAPLHEADQYEAFYHLHHVDGLEPKDIAGRFGLQKKRVAQLLALGKLHAKILEAWRAGKIDIEEAQAFTLAPSEAEQAKLFDKLAKQNNLRAWSIRKELGAGDHDIARLMTFVGKEAYRKAGGVLVEDLFGKDHIVAQPALLKRLADEKLAAEKARLLAEGWSWVETGDNIPDRYNYGHLTTGERATPEEQQRLAELRKIAAQWEEAGEPTEEQEKAADAAEAEIEQLEAAIAARGYTAAQKASAGCFVTVGYRGQMEVDLGRIAPKASRAAKDAAAKGKASKPPISNALAAELSERLTAGLRQALTSTPHVALAALVAGAQASDGPAKIRIGSTDAYGRFMPTDRANRSFPTLFQTLVAMTPEQLLEAAAGVAAAALSANVHRADQDPMKEHKGLPLVIQHMDAEAVRGAVGRAFDAKVWCEKVSKALVLAAVTEAAGPDAAKLLASKAKGELVKAAAATLRETGWLPPQLRTVHYQGPVAAPKAKGSRRKAA